MLKSAREAQNCKYFSTLLSPQSSLTTGIVAGTSKSNNVDSESEPSNPPQERSCFLASLMAALVAQWTETARSNGGSPDAANKIDK